MRAGVAIAILVAIALPGMVRAQSSADAAPLLLLHPGVATVLELPEKIERASVHDREDLRVAVVGNELVVRPWPGTPVGTDALLDVETRTARWTFRLRVVARARDANRNVRVLPVRAPAPEESTPEVRPEQPAEPEAPPDTPAEVVALSAEPVAASTIPRSAAEPAASAPNSAASTEPIPDPQPTERPTVTAGGRGVDLSAYLVMGLGVTALDFTGYDPRAGFQPHYALGIRVAGEPAGKWWALEVELSAESLAGPLVYTKLGDPDLSVSGPWLRAMLGARAQRGTRWRPSAYAGIGAHAHLRETIGSPRPDGAPSSTLAYGGILALGMGLQYRTRHISLGFDVQGRFGEPDEYHSIVILLTVGRILVDEENKP